MFSEIITESVKIEKGNKDNIKQFLGGAKLAFVLWIIFSKRISYTYTPINKKYLNSKLASKSNFVPKKKFRVSKTNNHIILSIECMLG